MSVNSRESSVATETKEVFTFSTRFTVLRLPSKVVYGYIQCAILA